MTDQRNYIDDDEEEMIAKPLAFAMHPGLFLKDEVLPGYNIKAAALADHIGVARPGFNNMLTGKRSLTAPLARKIERAISYPAGFLMRMQANYDLAQEEEPAWIGPMIQKRELEDA